MKKNVLLLSVIGLLLSLCACHKPTADEKAAPLMTKIDSLYQRGEYQATLNAITRLRADYPEAIASRKRALKIWQDASLKMTQQEIGRTDSALQAAQQQYATFRSSPSLDGATRLKANLLKARIDSLQIRYNALCGTVRVIRYKASKP